VPAQVVFRLPRAADYWNWLRWGRSRCLREGARRARALPYSLHRGPWGSGWSGFW